MQEARDNLVRPSRVASLVFASASFTFANAWAAYLLYWAFTEDVSELLIVLVVATVPPIASTVGLLATALKGERARTLRWVSAGVLMLSISSPGLMGFGYVPAAVLMIVAALMTATAEKSRSAMA